ncbi:MAG: hypothetical protein IME97_08505, partial [Proteobacteria bacterium]|nr:hypothetical protein [Pseudomonadota bacterium]
MSSILRALKKLESEPKHLDESQGTGHKYISLAGPEHRSSNLRPLLLFIGGGVACGMVLLAGWWFVNGKQEQGASAVKEVSAPAKTMATATGEPESTVAPEPATSPPQTMVQPAMNQPISLPKPAAEKNSRVIPAAPGAKLPEPVVADHLDTGPEITGESPVIASPPVPAQIAVQKTPPEPAVKEAPIATAVQPVAPAETSEPEIPILHDADVKLQSISWSKNPSKRLAVISNRIVREGGMVSGYLLVTINKDDVILSQNREKWRINFR